jgi:hypothetical protein
MDKQIIHETVKAIQEEITFPWDSLANDFPNIPEFFHLLASRDSSTPESVFFAIASAMACISSKNTKLPVGIREITPVLWIVSYNRSGTGKSIPLRQILQAFNSNNLDLSRRRERR